MLVNILNICSDDELMSDTEEAGETEGKPLLIPSSLSIFGKGDLTFLWKLTMPRMCPFLLTDHLKAFCRQFGSWFSRVWVLWCLQEAGGGPVPSQCNVTINDLMPTVPPWRPNIVIGQGIGGLNDNLTIYCIFLKTNHTKKVQLMFIILLFSFHCTFIKH